MHGKGLRRFLWQQEGVQQVEEVEELAEAQDGVTVQAMGAAIEECLANRQEESKKGGFYEN